MDALLARFYGDTHFQSVTNGIENGLDEQLIAGLSGSSRTLFTAAIYRKIQKPLIYVTHNLNHAQKVVEDFQELLSEDEVLLYPANELTVAELSMAGQETSAERIRVMSTLSRGFHGILVVPYAGFRKKLMPYRLFRDAHIALAEGDQLPIETFMAKLTNIGYERTGMVEKQGEFSVRGGIVDIFPPIAPRPYRIEWFDDEIDTIREIDPDNQRSIERVSDIVIPPAHELFADEETLFSGGERLESVLRERMRRIGDPKVKSKLLEHIGWDVEQLKTGVLPPTVYKYVSLIYPDCANLLAYMPTESILVFDDPARVQETAKQLEREEAEWETSLLKEGKSLPEITVADNYMDLMSKTSQQKLYLTTFLRQVPHTQPLNLVNFITRSMQQFHGQIHVLKSEWERWQKTNNYVVFLASSRERAARLERVLGDYGMEVDIVDNPVTLPNKPIILINSLQSGFEFPSIRLVVITEEEIFTQKRRARRRTDKVTNAERIKSYQELTPGDYVVHVNHGIGKYLGIKTLEVAGMHKDYLHIRYKGNDKLFVPVEQIDLVQKYVGGEERTPKVYSLGSSEWSKVKNRVKSSVEDIASDLIKLYAKRQASKGHKFSENVPYLSEFEALFPYEETPDQKRTIQEVYEDMERPIPMDRLICGDVGYGKTEVAIRAAFKAVMDGKQVAILVPTTILAQQHYETFSERFHDYPVEIHVLSRFRTAKEQSETIKGLKQGTVDIVIGTHRLLSKDVQFKDLGLLVVDEEQRFGVKHKEKIKRLRHNVDVLTLTATPIPRTLHMSMLGVRDLSLIETPPENRFPVQTYVIEYNDVLVREAIERELARGGQVYFLYNQVHDIQRMTDHIAALVPDARVAYAHGQMSESELERVMLDFLDGEFDVLVSTTIIETGVDIPNVNTLIIYDADKMGLSQLYQLRGRVGRSNRIAYAYFTYRHGKVLTEEAEKRLEAIREFTELGSGFKIAMRDLAIRGAGNLLGSEQHGHIASVGFDLYSQMLKEAIEEMKGETDETKTLDPTVEIKLDAYIPETYIEDEKQKIEMYKKIRGVDSLDSVTELEHELVDRFGEPPPPVTRLLKAARFRVLAKRLGIQEIKEKGTSVFFTFLSSISGGEELVKLAREFKSKIRLIPGTSIRVELKIKGLNDTQKLELIDEFLLKCEVAFKSEREVQHAANE